MSLPQYYLDENKGVRPAPYQESFNNIIYTYWYYQGQKLNKNCDSVDIAQLQNYVNKTQDKDGLYKPKASHDNMSYLLIAKETLDIKIKKPKLLKTIKHIGWYRVWDVVLYTYLLGNPFLRFLAFLFLPITCLQLIQSVASKGKIRPSLFDSNKPRWKWWFLPKKMLVEESEAKIEGKSIRVVYYKTWNGKIKAVRKMQNDGKHLALFKLYAFKDRNFMLKLTAKICDKIYKKKYGDQYPYKIIKKYFLDKNHPDIEVWSKVNENLLGG